MYEIYTVIESTLLIGILLRIVFALTYSKARISHNTEFLLFIILSTVNTVLFSCFEQTDKIFMFIHSYLPIAILSGILIKFNIHIGVRLLIPLLLGTLIHHYSNQYVIVSIYIAAIYHLLNEGAIRVNSNARERKKIPAYMILAINLASTQILFMLQSTGFDWHSSQYIVYYQYFLYIVYLSTYLILHVRFRRLFIN